MRHTLMVGLLLLAARGCGHAQSPCPITQASGVNVGLCAPTVDHLQLNPASASLQLNGTLQFTATYILTDGSSGGDATAACDRGWSSDNTTNVTVSIYGLATGAAAGSAHVSCTAANTACTGNVLCTGSALVTVLAPPVFTNPSQGCAQPCPLTQAFGPPNAVAYNFPVSAGGSVHTPYTYSVSSGSLPAWASISSSTGAITGTPNAVATTTFTLQVCDSIPSCNTLQVSLTVIANSSSYYPLSTTSTLQQNKVAGKNSNIPTGLQGTAAITNVAVTSNIVTVTVANNFSAGSAGGACVLGSTCGDTIGLSGFTNSATTWLNGLVMGANSSTTGSSVVGPVFNTQGVQVTHSNVGSTADTTGYMQGTGWQMFVTAPAPFSGSTNCTTGNPCTGQTGVLVAGDINTCGFDFSVAGATGLNKNSWTMWTNPASTSNTVYHPSKTSETYDELISWPDGSNGYFVPFVSSTIFLGHAHYSATACNGQPGVILDTTVPSGWYGTNSFGLALSQLPPPNPNQAVGYFVDLSLPFDPKVTKQVYQYQATGCSGNPCVTLLSSTVLADVPSICPAWGFTTIGAGIQLAKAVMVGTSDGTHDTDLNFAIGAGPQNQLGKNMEFHIGGLNSGSPTCDNWDTSGKSGTTMYNDGTTAGLFTSTQGSGYKVGDVISFRSGNNCVGTVTITGITGTGGVKLSGGLGLPTMTTNSGCTLGTVLTISGGSGTGLALTESGVGTSSIPCCMTTWPSGSTTPTVTTLYTYGIHGGTMSKGAPISIANSGYGNTTQKTCVACDNVYWFPATNTLKAQTSTLVAGHPAIGVTHRGTSTSPPYTVSLWSDPTCTPSTNCVQIATLPSCPGGTINHSSWPSGDPLTDLGPITITSMQNVPGKPAQTNPANCTTAFGFSIWAADQSGTPRWFTHSYENTNNNATEDGNGTYVEIICSPDRQFCIVPTDMNNPGSPVQPTFSGNVGLGVDKGGNQYVGMFAVTLN